MKKKDGGPQVIGLVGGICSGKSLVAQLLADRGAGLLDADRAGHAVLDDPEVRAALRAKWGLAVIGPDGHVDRKQVAARVFVPGGEEERKFLDGLTHPRIGELLAKQAEAWLAAGRAPVLVLDAPLLLEAGWRDRCDRLVFVEAPREVRLARALVRGWSEAEFASREAAQMPVEEKRRLADVAIDNGGSSAETAAQVDALWHTLE